jgi:hypothetical protein
MNANKELWWKAFTTDPRAVKPITGKQYKGNSPKPYWIVERLTDEFGPCGIGWGFTILNERFERFGEGASAEALHVAVVRFWYVMSDKRGEFEQVGQTRASYTSAGGKFIVDEDAPKKSVTDALVKCASYLGFAGDIFSGMWDDSKYVQQAGEEWDRRSAGEPRKPESDGMSPKARAERITGGVASGDAAGAAFFLSSLDQKELDAIWQHLDADTTDKLTAAWPK